MAGKSIYDVFKTDEQAENEGAWFNYGPGPSGHDQKFLLARASRSNKKYTKALQRMQERYGKQIESGTLADDTAYELLLKVFCTTVLLDWTGICGQDGVELPYSTETAISLMRELPDLYAELQAHAGSREHFRRVSNEETAGN
jgi:hypothetical protein